MSLARNKHDKREVQLALVFIPRQHVGPHCDDLAASCRCVLSFVFIPEESLFNRMLLVEFGFTICVLGQAATALQLHQPRATPVNQLFPMNGWTPKPTSKPKSPLELLRRQDDPGLCGYLEGDLGSFDLLSLVSMDPNDRQITRSTAILGGAACTTTCIRGSAAALEPPSQTAMSTRRV